MFLGSRRQRKTRHHTCVLAVKGEADLSVVICRRYDMLEEEFGDVVPWELRRRTFGQGEMLDNGTMVYGDGTYPYNPSPYKDWVDGRTLRPGELERLDEIMAQDYYDDEADQYPWRGQNPYFDTDEAMVGLGTRHPEAAVGWDPQRQGSFDAQRAMQSEVGATLDEVREDGGGENEGDGETVGGVMKGRFALRDGGDKSVSVLAKGMGKMFGAKPKPEGKMFGARSETAKALLRSGRDKESGMDVLARGLKRSLGGGSQALAEGVDKVGGDAAERNGGIDVLAAGLKKSLQRRSKSEDKKDRAKEEKQRLRQMREGQGRG